MKHRSKNSAALILNMHKAVDIAAAAGDTAAVGRLDKGAERERVENKSQMSCTSKMAEKTKSSPGGAMEDEEGISCGIQECWGLKTWVATRGTIKFQ